MSGDGSVETVECDPLVPLHSEGVKGDSCKDPSGPEARSVGLLAFSAVGESASAFCFGASGSLSVVVAMSRQEGATRSSRRCNRHCGRREPNFSSCSLHTAKALIMAGMDLRESPCASECDFLPRGDKAFASWKLKPVVDASEGEFDSLDTSRSRAVNGNLPLEAAEDKKSRGSSMSNVAIIEGRGCVWVLASTAGMLVAVDVGTCSSACPLAAALVSMQGGPTCSKAANDFPGDATTRLPGEGALGGAKGMIGDIGVIGATGAAVEPPKVS
mmetsp:Transcript_6427/g.14060  ORF Transcript_6427/g.14060 Transcript_6427/m.14060 type:complete len:272 (+) Transcript_6427:667-1482(+)